MYFQHEFHFFDELKKTGVIPYQEYVIVLNNPINELGLKITNCFLTNEQQIDYNSCSNFYWYRYIRYDKIKNATIDLTKMSILIDSQISNSIFLNQYFPL